MKKDPIFEQKKSRAFAIMAGKGMWHSLYAPPCHVFLWRLGLRVAPPPFAPFLTNFLSFTGVYTPFWGLVMWIVHWRELDTSPSTAAALALAAGIAFGLSTAALELWRSKANHLPPWRQV
ncbi:hypothetical protein M2693_005131 [Salmonella enterica]|nr:hypothetical protein [Salmonella enterica]